MVYDRFEPAPGIALDEYLVPYTSATLIDDESTGILTVYYPEALEMPCRIDGETLAGRMGLQIKLYRLVDNEGIRGQIYFEEHSASVLSDDGEAVSQVIPTNTILVNSSLCYGDDGYFSEEKLNDTIIHECYHAYRHRLFYLGQCLYNSDLRCLSCTVVGQQIGAMIDSDLEAVGTSIVEGLPLAANCFYGKTPIDWMEWQANRATPRIRMTAPTAEIKIEELLSYYKTRYPGISTPRLFSRVIADFADFYGVSKQSAKRRLIELGYNEAKGVLNYVNGRYAIDYEFSPGSLGSNQTFTIDFESAIELFRNDDSFRECVGSGLYQYVDDHFCLADSRYIYRRNGILHLTSCAKSHMDECCLVFTLRSTGPEYSYREGTLLKEMGSGGTVAEFDGQRLEVDYFAAAQRLSGIINDLPRSPCGTLKAHMDRRKITVEALVAKSGVSEKTIKRLRSDPEYTPTKRNAMAICIGLQLEPMLQRDWMGKLGIVMTASTTDVFFELLMGSLYKQPLSVFNEKLQEHGYPPLSRCVDELDS